MANPRKTDAALRGFRPLFLLVLVFVFLSTAIIWYASMEPPLDWTAGEPPNVFGEVRDMILTRTAAVTIDESELNALLKPELYERRRLGENAEITGADFSLAGDTIILRTDVTLWNRIRLPISHTIRLTWDKPDLVAEHVSSSLRDLPIPAAFFPIGTIRIPLAQGDGRFVEVDRVSFEDNAVRLHLRPRLP